MLSPALGHKKCRKWIFLSYFDFFFFFLFFFSLALKIPVLFLFVLKPVAGAGSGEINLEPEPVNKVTAAQRWLLKRKRFALKS